MPIRSRLLALLFLAFQLLPALAQQAPVYIWLEPESFPAVTGKYRYWPGTMTQPLGHWAIAGPGISAEFSQGGESGWNSIGVPAEETNASCSRDVIVPRAGRYHLWVRYVDHRGKQEPFTARVIQGNQEKIARKLGMEPAVPPNDEYMLYWGFSFGWAALEGELTAGPATLSLLIDSPGEAWRQVDAILITDDPGYTPIAREKPSFTYLDTFGLIPADGPSWRGAGIGQALGAHWKRGSVAGKDFTLWATVGADAQWWSQQNPDTLTPYEVFFHYATNPDIIGDFHKQYAGRTDVPLISWPNMILDFYLGEQPDFSPGSRLFQWLEKTKMPFAMKTNYATKPYKQDIGPASYAALRGPLASQFLGAIHGEYYGTNQIQFDRQQLGPDRRSHLAAFATQLRTGQAVDWSRLFGTPVPETFWDKGIACLSCNSISLAPFFHEAGAKIVGYEIDATNAHASMRIAFERGAARQYGGDWINYASSNFGDACNTFAQEPIGRRGAKAWYHSKYAITDGVNISWYRKLYYLNYLGGALAIFWEQGLANQWIKPGPGTHPIQLSPFGVTTVDFQQFVDRVQDRGEPYTPVAFLLNYAHGYDPVSYTGKAFDYFPENPCDRELRELFNVAWHPAEQTASQPINPDLQSMASGTYGNIFDVLIDKPERAAILADYPVVWAAGDVELGGKMTGILRDYIANGGTLVVNVNAARGKLPESLLGVAFTNNTRTVTQWTPAGMGALPCTPCSLPVVKPAGNTLVLAAAAPDVPLITRARFGKGAVILTLLPGMIGLDERAHPALPWLMNGITAELLPVQVQVNGKRPEGGLMYQLNRTKTGWLVMLMNNQGVDKTQTGIARVDRRASIEVTLRTRLPITTAREYTQPRPLTLVNNGQEKELRVRVHPGDLQVVGLQ